MQFSGLEVLFSIFQSVILNLVAVKVANRFFFLGGGGVGVCV